MMCCVRVFPIFNFIDKVVLPMPLKLLILTNHTPSGIFYRLAKLTSRTKKNAKMNIYERYQGHDKALSKAGLAPKVHPTMNEIWKKADASKMKKDAKQEEKSGGKERSTYFCKGSLRYGGKRFTTSLKSFVILTVLNGCARGCPIIDSLT